MIIEEVDQQSYLKVIKHNYIFDSVEFNELNKFKVHELKYLVFKEKKIRFGLCIGIKDNQILCPFSAPFGSLVATGNSVSIQYIDKAIDAIDEYMVKNMYISIRFILPPIFYDESNISMLVNTFFRKGYRTLNIDLNYQFDLDKVYLNEYESLLPRNGRKNLRIAQQSSLLLKNCYSIEDIKQAYEIIECNRKSKGYPLRMSLNEVLNTIQFVNHNIFLTMKDEKAIASAIVYHVNDNIAQVIYWGDLPGYGEYKPINYLAYQLIQFYGERKFRFLDIGPSTENSIPNYGLCDFKSSIGCDASVKITMIKLADVI